MSAVSASRRPRQEFEFKATWSKEKNLFCREGEGRKEKEERKKGRDEGGGAGRRRVEERDF